MEMTASQKLSEFFTDLRYESLPQKTKDKVCSCVLDMLECVYSANTDDLRISSSFSTSIISGSKSCRLWGTENRSEAEKAAYYNAARAAVSYRNSLDRNAGVHPVEIVAASSFAVAEENDLPLSSVYLGIVCGVEIMGRIGSAVAKAGKNPAVRMSALCGPIGASVAAAVAMGLSANQICSAIALSSHFSFGTNQWGNEGTGEDVYQAGFSAMTGVFVARLVSNGAVGANGSLDGTAGLLAAYNADAFCSCLDVSLKKGFAVDNIEFKSVEGCLMTQSPSRAIMNLEDIPKPEDIDRIYIRLSKQALTQPGCNSLAVENEVQAKMNIRYVVSSLVNGIRPERIQWTPPYSERVLALMNMIYLEEDPEKTEQFPARIPADIDFLLKNGLRIHASVADFGGLSEEESRERFISVFSCVRSTEKATEILQLLSDSTTTVRCLSEKLI